ncbi:N-acetylmuramoyl-L-alanine amidase [bacterium]|nr:N-acetylmuramoyl-L-alanine amidase [bacterium]MBU1599660.1 N-acetylmuramoyl-L-alanine amidase [bacterium]
MRKHIFFLLLTSFVFSEENIRLIGYDTQRFIISSWLSEENLLPMKETASILEAKVDYNPITKEGILSKGKSSIKFWAEKSEAILDGEKVLLDHYPKVVQGRVYLPLELVEKFCGKSGVNICLNPEKEELIFTKEAICPIPLNNKESKEVFWHRVEKGENLWRIAQQYNLSLPTLVSLNNISDPTKVKVGDKIFIPQIGLSQTSTIGNRESLIKSPKDSPQALSPKPQTQNLEPRTLNIEPRTPNPDLTAKDNQITGTVLITNKDVQAIRKDALAESKGVQITNKDIQSQDTKFPTNKEAKIAKIDSLIEKKGSPILRFGIKKIVIDAGHGGKDPGACGKTLKEKDVVLQMAKRLKEKIEEKSGIEVILTRDDDYYVPLPERTALANYKKADLFVSIHANAAFSKGATGFEVFHLSARASNREAEALAELENKAIKLDGKEGVKDYTQQILADMAQQGFIKESIELASIIQKEVVSRLDMKARGVKSANFYVLRDALMPAVLVETGFLSNGYEESRLKDEKFLEGMTDSLCDAILKYKESYETALKE